MTTNEAASAGNGSATEKTVLCLASYEKGGEFLRAAKRLGWRTILVTVTALEHADWPRESIDEFFHMPDLSKLEDVVKAVSYLARARAIARIVPLDDYDVETAAALREHLRLPGMNASRARLWRDKLAMRVRARETGIPVPEFVHVLNDAAIRAFTERVPPPWVLKPRSEVSTIGIAKIGSPDDLWPRVDELGDRRSFFLLERFVPGGVYHADSIVADGAVVFAETHGYARPPLEVFHEGGIAMTRTLPRESDDARALLALNRRVVAALGMDRGAAHVEFIKGEADGQMYFLEAGARVGGANIVDVVEAATGVNLWREWARLEVGPEAEAYAPPERKQDYAGVILTLARQEQPDTSAYTDPEIAQRIVKRHHAGLVVAAPDAERVRTLLDDYSRRFATDFFASLPPTTDPKASRDAALHGGDQQ
jgi:biotin carboxylase